MKFCLPLHSKQFNGFTYVVLYHIDVRVYHTRKHFLQHQRQVRKDEYIQHHILHPFNNDAFMRILLRIDTYLDILQNLRR